MAKPTMTNAQVTWVYGNWKYFRSGKYIYGWSTQKQPQYGDKYISFVRRWHKTKSQYVTVESKTATHASRKKAKERCSRLAHGTSVLQPPKQDKPALPNDHGYCMSCKVPKKIDSPEKVTQTTKTGKTRYAITGHCPDCDTKMFKYISETKECPGCMQQRKVSEFPDGFPWTCKSCRE